MDEKRARREARAAVEQAKHAQRVRGLIAARRMLASLDAIRLERTEIYQGSVRNEKRKGRFFEDELAD